MFRIVRAAILTVLALTIVLGVTAAVQFPEQQRQERCLYAASRAIAGFDPAEGLDVSDC